MCTRSEIVEYSISITKKHSQTEYSCDFYVSKWKVYFTSNFNFFFIFCYRLTSGQCVPQSPGMYKLLLLFYVEEPVCH